MNELELCPACGVPLIVSRNLYWENNGVIAVKASPGGRFVFFESDTIDQMLKGIEELIGLPIEHVVLESRSREARRYIDRSLPPELRKPFQDLVEKESSGSDIPPETKENLLALCMGVTQAVVDIGRAYGYGDQRLSDTWESSSALPWRIPVIRNPHSLLNFIGDQLGSVEAIEERDMQVRYEETEADTYRIEIYPGAHPVELKERLKRRRYEFKPGELQYERCTECEIPLEVAKRKWDVKEGTITDIDTGRRMAIFGPSAADAIFDDLEAELGESIPEMVIEAQRRYIRSAWGAERWNMSGAAFRQMMAVRGLGSIVHFNGDRDHLSLTIENSCFHLPIIGTIQALVELAYRAENSNVEWELAGDGDLSLTVTIS